MIIFGWLTAQNKILTHNNLRKRGCIIVSRCHLWKSAEETVQHLLQECSFTKRVYQEITAKWPSRRWPTTPVIDITDSTVRATTTKEQRAQILIMQFVIWRERCARCFTERIKTVNNMVKEVGWQWQVMQLRDPG